MLLASLMSFKSHRHLFLSIVLSLYLCCRWLIDMENLPGNCVRVCVCRVCVSCVCTCHPPFSFFKHLTKVNPCYYCFLTIDLSSLCRLFVCLTWPLSAGTAHVTCWEAYIQYCSSALSGTLLLTASQQTDYSTDVWLLYPWPAMFTHIKHTHSLHFQITLLGKVRRHHWTKIAQLKYLLIMHILYK